MIKKNNIRKIKFTFSFYFIKLGDLFVSLI